MNKRGFTDSLIQAISYRGEEDGKAAGKKRDLADWLEKAVVMPGFLLFLLQFLLLGMIRHGDHLTVRSRPFFVPRQIEDAVEAGERIYILYHDSGAVNVYDSQGQFQWALSIPWHDHNSDARLRVGETSLFLYQRGYDVYQFDRETGALKTFFPWAGREEEFPNERSPKASGEKSEWEPGKGCYDDLTVYRAGEDGELVPLIRRGGWVRLLYFGSAWVLTGLGIAFSAFIHSDIGPALRRKNKGK